MPSKSAHDVAEGGLAVAIAECCIAGEVGAEIALADVGESGLFGEAPGVCFVVSAESEAALEAAGLVRMHVIGRVGRRFAVAQRRCARAESSSFRTAVGARTRPRRSHLGPLLA